MRDDQGPQVSSGSSDLQLTDGSRVAVMGGGPAGSFFTYFLLDMAERLGTDIQVDVYEPRDFSCPGPRGCNMCGGIVSESLVQVLASEGINLPTTVVQRGIDSYILHMDVGSVRIDTPLHEKRIGAVYRGPGPRDVKEVKWDSFDGHLQSLAAVRGANIFRERVTDIRWNDGRPQIVTAKGAPDSYDLLAVSVGVNTVALKLFQESMLNYRSPRTTKTMILEYSFGDEDVGAYLGSSMHVFLLDIPRLEFAALVPKGDYMSLCLLGEDIDESMVRALVGSQEFKRCLPPGFRLDHCSCQCAPRINVGAAVEPFADRAVFIGDSGVTRLYKDGIGAAYTTAKAAATTAALHGVSAADFRKYYWPTCRRINTDNGIGKIIFAITRQIQRRVHARQAVLRMVTSEQEDAAGRRPMSTVLWDTFTGSAPYREIFMGALRPRFWLPFLWYNLAALFGRGARQA